MRPPTSVLRGWSMVRPAIDRWLGLLTVPPAGAVVGFGYNGLGQLGNPINSGTRTANPAPLPVALPGQAGQVAEIAVGLFHSLALTSSGQLYAFGYNKWGQLGNTSGTGTENANPVPALVTLPGQTGHVTQIAAGAFHSLALTSSGQLYAFGSNKYGELG